MRTVSWIILLLVGGLIILGSLASVGLAYFGGASDDVVVGNVTLGEVVGDRPDVESALRGRRGTAAAFALGFAVLLLFVVLGPYRHGAVWAWWAILVSTSALALVVIARIAVLNSTLGASTGGILLGAVVIALLLDIKRLKRSV
ncbi:MAG: hypothetical protein ACRD1R_20130 [Acidobacteriota bacterium]